MKNWNPRQPIKFYQFAMKNDKVIDKIRNFRYYRPTPLFVRKDCNPR